MKRPMSAATRGYKGYLARNIQPAMAQMGKQLADLESTVISLKMWLGFQGLAGEPKRRRKTAQP